MYLDEIVAAQKRGEAKGITSVCSAHPYVIKQTLKVFEYPLIEATCNQVNQYGGYTGMTPKDFVAYVRKLVDEVDIPFENIILGGDHLGPNVWQNEPAESAMQKAGVLMQDYIKAGFTKIHLDCSMRLADDPPGALDAEVSAWRAAQLAKVAESAEGTGLAPVRLPRYIIGTEVPIPGGATEHESGVQATEVRDARRTLEVTRDAFLREGFESAWERVIALVVQPGVEFGDDFVLPYQPDTARELSKFIEDEPMVYEVHSTDYQTRVSLKDLVHDHFAILKVGPALTFAYREAVFALAMMENELFAREARSNLIQVIDEVMTVHPQYWEKYYHGAETEQAFKRKFSLSDRIRYYWVDERVQKALIKLMNNLGGQILPSSLLGRFVERKGLNAGQVIEWKINKALEDYVTACGVSLPR